LSGGSRRLLWQRSPDGSWQTNVYVSTNRLAMTISGWTNAAFTASSNDARCVLYDYTPIAGSGDDGTEPDLPRMKAEKIAGIEVARTYYVYQTVNEQEVMVEERCAGPADAYGSTNNQRTTTVYLPRAPSCCGTLRVKSKAPGSRLNIRLR
jgi:hypothetical protein